MTTYTYVTLEIKEAESLADLIGIEYDLKKTIEWSNMLLQIKSDQHMFHFIEPLTTAILVQFTRIFAQGIRKKNIENIWSVLSKNERNMYNHFKDIRDKHIAHSVNAYEENEVRARYIEEVIDKGIISIDEGGHRFIGLSDSDINSIQNICATLKNKVMLEKVIQKDYLLKIVSKYTEVDIRNCEQKTPKQKIDVKKTRRKRSMESE